MSYQWALFCKGELLKYISTFSGIEAASAAWEPIGWEPVAFCEIDEFPSAVLAHHYPDVPNLGDITKVDWERVIDEYGRPDVVVGGSPCQSFSVAGGRESLGGESRLMFEYIRACDEVRSPWILWENVPGVLNTKDNAFAQLLDSLQDIGYVDLAWRVLDAQFFGVAQRRRRVFLVGRLGDWGGASAVLFESESVSGNTQTSKQKREELARAAGRGSGARGGAGCLTPWDAQSKRIFIEDGTAPTLNSGDREGGNIQPSVLQAVALQTGHTAANGSGINTDDVSYTVSTSSDQAVAFAQNTRDEVRIVGGDRQMVGALAASPGAKQQSYVCQPVCMASAAANAEIGEQICQTIMAHAAKTPPIVLSNNADVVGALCARDYKGVGKQYAEEGKVICQRVTSSKSVAEPTPTSSGTAGVGTAGKDALVEMEVAYTLAASQDQTILTDVGGTADEMAVTIHDGSRWVVRRLTPVECERLQGFPDNYTDIPYKGKEHPPDTPRYKALGNSMAVPVMRWIGERIQTVDEVIKSMKM
jgi:DNA (cytosine-5)-methyltransferase 1